MRSLSSSETLRDTIEAVSAAVEALGQETVSQTDVSALLTAAVRLYTSYSEEPYGRSALAELRVTPTEACTVAAALLRSQSLTPFEFSIWFSSR